MRRPRPTPRVAKPVSAREDPNRLPNLHTSEKPPLSLYKRALLTPGEVAYNTGITHDKWPNYILEINNSTGGSQYCFVFFKQSGNKLEEID